AGVMCLFASLATAMGFTMLHIQQAFPDCTAFRRGQDGLWRIVRIEFEFESRNFLAHGHDPRGCDLIVCWKHNWDSCPVQVVELSGLVAAQHLPRRHGDTEKTKTKKIYRGFARMTADQKRLTTD